MRTFLCAIFFIGVALNANTQDSNNLIESMEVEVTISTLFEGMYRGDSSMVHSTFIDDVRLMTSYTSADGKNKLKEGGLAGFLNSVGTPHEIIWDERISNLIIQVDDNLAHAWMDYSFYLGDQFSHCGVNAMQLVKIKGNWKIVHLIDTRRKTDCAE